MARGRKKDLTIPPTRSLTQQRDYRARRAKYIADLEERCKRIEEENRQLRHQLEIARANAALAASTTATGTTMFSDPAAVELSAELLRNLSAASEALTRFQDFAKQHPMSGQTPSVPSVPLMGQSHNDVDMAPSASTVSQGRSMSPREHSEPPSVGQPPPPPESTPGVEDEDLEAECCGGYFDCDKFLEHPPTMASLGPLDSNERSTSRL
ncbi:hypothetical protein CC1G_09350 [Coprinopsis cinerea okayama7|uniref:BZIP domain-containing protein n=1 Tax=Coprinopsis cinerea (strain Okayama-7 / 130 / ATCC MYA-4618 / FGSC 9003) TaxID=240176 RepID=A8N5P5_COPC7|nr:hypothetical protein CC1G_09350 [Coprinopsis cinerea okayama7\|eukprot:XP_001830190.2 hypothetical protein CC1G_09350 [Coprinopsis cinerea okayama7\